MQLIMSFKFPQCKQDQPTATSHLFKQGTMHVIVIVIVHITTAQKIIIGLSLLL